MAVRERFDAFCLEQTLTAGAAFRNIESILALREHATHVEIDLTTADGRETLTAPVLIGADGSNGQTRRLASNDADPTWYTRGFALEATVPYSALPERPPAGDAPHDLIFDFAPLPGGYGWLFPKGDHINIGVGAFAPNGSGDADLKLVSRELLAQYTREKLDVELASLSAQITGQHLGMGGHAYTPRGRVLLTGDAAGLVDPLTGEGIHSAIVSGQAAATAVISGASDIAAAYAQQLQRLQQTLAFSHRAARHFYATPERGFRVMRMPLLRSLVLKTYADGLPRTKLLATLARLVA
jgi:flavin-dependent dehydrogenase